MNESTWPPTPSASPSRAAGSLPVEVEAAPARGPAGRPARAAPAASRRYLLPLVLFGLTCWSTYWAGGLGYAVPVMAILLAHEMGHFVQALRYHVPASLPYFIPVPFSPLGTMGAIISMQGFQADRRALFDIGISGPLAGLVPALVAVAYGTYLSTPVPVLAVEQAARNQDAWILGAPLLQQWITALVKGPLPADVMLNLHPIAMAGWVGLFVTGLNLIPVGQLDGGHVAYALLGRWAHRLAFALLALFAAMMVYYQYWGWTLWLVLLILIGPKHPPTADDNVPLGGLRRALGWASLAFIIVGFTPVPFEIW